MTLKLGIDLSTTNTGIVCLNDDNSFVFKRDLKLMPFNDGNWEINANRITNWVYDFWLWNVQINTKVDKVEIGIELANFRNPKLTQRFSLYCGVFLGKFYELYNKFKNGATDPLEMRVVTFNSNAWQSYLGLKPQDTREFRKMRARMFSKVMCENYEENWSEDVCDAFCIAYHLQLIRSSQEMSESVKLRKTKIISQEKKIWAIEKKINTQLKQLVVLDKIRNARKIENINKKVKELQEEKDRLCQEKKSLKNY